MFRFVRFIKILIIVFKNNCGLILIYYLVEAFGDEALLVAVLFTLISVITLPHMLVVEQMYRAFDKTKISE